MTKNAIGAIRIHENETHVELHPDAVDGFLEALGPSRKIEKTITVDRIEGMPTEPTAAPRPPRKPRQDARGAERGRPRTPSAEIPAADPVAAATQQAAPVRSEPSKPTAARSDRPQRRDNRTDGQRSESRSTESRSTDDRRPDNRRHDTQRSGRPHGDGAATAPPKRDRADPAERPLKRRRKTAGDQWWPEGEEGAPPSVSAPVVGSPVDATPLGTSETAGRKPKKAKKPKGALGRISNRPGKLTLNRDGPGKAKKPHRKGRPGPKPTGGS